MTLSSMFRTPPPSVAVQIAPRFVSAIALQRHGTSPVVAAHGFEPLPPGLVTPSLNGQNLSDVKAVGQAVGRLLARLGARARRVALVVPDSIAKVSLVKLDAVPERAQDLDQLIRFHVRKAAPFNVDEAQVSYSAASALPGGAREFVVAVARRNVIREFEAACAEAGAHAGLVDLATFSLVNAVLGSEGGGNGDALLVHLTADYASIVILRGANLIFFRNRTEGAEESVADLVHQTAMYYEDRLGGGGFARVTVAGGDGMSTTSLEAVRQQLDGRLGLQTHTIDPQRLARFSDRISADPALMTLAAPLVGILARFGAGTEEG